MRLYMCRSIIQNLWTTIPFLKLYSYTCIYNISHGILMLYIKLNIVIWISGPCKGYLQFLLKYHILSIGAKMRIIIPIITVLWTLISLHVNGEYILTSKDIKVYLTLQFWLVLIQNKMNYNYKVHHSKTSCKYKMIWRIYDQRVFWHEGEIRTS